MSITHAEIAQGLPFVSGGLSALAVLLIVLSRRKPVRVADGLDSRLAPYEPDRLDPDGMDELELARPFSDRFVRPGLDRLGKRLTNIQPKELVRRRQTLLDRAGRPWGMNPGSLLALQLVLAVVLATAMAGVASLVNFNLVLGLGFGAVLGYMGPTYQIKRTAKARRAEMLSSLPNVLDLLCLSVEAGMGFEAALQRVAQKFHNALTREFTAMLNEIRVGRPRAEAMMEMARRADVEELTNIMRALVQSEHLGVGLATTLRIQASELRRERRQKAEAKAQQAGLKMLFPMVGCIFPVLFVVLLAPPAIKLIFHVN